MAPFKPFFFVWLHLLMSLIKRTITCFQFWITFAHFCLDSPPTVTNLVEMLEIHPNFGSENILPLSVFSEAQIFSTDIKHRYMDLACVNKLPKANSMSSTLN